jgi:hypothetical protein
VGSEPLWKRFATHGDSSRRALRQDKRSLSLFSCFDEGFGFFEQGEVFFVVGGFGVFDDDRLLHGSFAHGELGDFFSLQEGGGSQSSPAPSSET